MIGSKSESEYIQTVTKDILKVKWKHMHLFVPKCQVVIDSHHSWDLTHCISLSDFLIYVRSAIWFVCILSLPCVYNRKHIAFLLSIKLLLPIKKEVGIDSCVKNVELLLDPGEIMFKW